jgi:1-acyl-sn-glycerol-3-phosphate acyltransferase
MLFVRSLAFAIAFYLGSAFYVLRAAILAAQGPRGARHAAWTWARFHRWAAKTILGIHTRVEGVIPDRPVLYAIKHESMYETLEVLMLFDSPAVLAKKELTEIPFWGGIALRHGVIPIDRAGGAAALRALMKAARSAAEEGRSLVIFPEGTRVAHGERAPLRSGFAGLYRTIGLPVVPVAVDSGRVWPRRRFLKRPGVITFKFGEVIEPGLDRDAVEARVHAEINALNSPG